MRISILIALIVGSLWPVLVSATPQVGFVDGLWLSSGTLVEQEPVRIYAAIRNHSGSDITGTVTFFIDNQQVKVQPVSALDNRVIEAWADWNPSAGTHAIRATFSNITIDSISSGAEPIGDASELATKVTVKEAPPAPTPAESLSPPTSTTSLRSDYSGLEEYLAPSPARSMLVGITNWSSSTRQALQKRRQIDTSSSSPSHATTTPALPTQEDSTITDTKAEPSSITSDLYALVKRMLSKVVDGMYAVGIMLFGRPALVQVVLLIGILYGLYRSARYFGRRG